MIFREEPETEVFKNQEEGISIKQKQNCVFFSAHRARLIAAELIRHADEIEAEDKE